MLRIPVDRLRTELDQIVDMLNDIKTKVDLGVPGDDLPATELNQEVYQVQLHGELLLISQRLNTLAEVIGG